MKKKVTIQDIADALGISRNTVSKAINNTEGIAEATREKILQKAVEMGYKQFSYVHAMTEALQNEAQTEENRFEGEIALLTTNLFSRSHFASVMLDRFHQEMAQMGYTMSIYRVEPDNILRLSLPKTLIPERISGLICFELFDYRYCEMICSLGIPVLFVDGPSKINGKSLPCDQLYMENTVELTGLVQTLLSRGLRRIGFIGDWTHCQSFYERYLAYRNAMLFAGVPVEERFLIKRNWDQDLLNPLNALEEMPDVFLCANDFVAYDAIRILRARGIRIPEDVQFCGFDDSPESRFLVPALTTVHIHTQIMAYEAAQLLLSRMREPSLDYRIVYTETYLIERESTLGTGKTTEDLQKAASSALA